MSDNGRLQLTEHVVLPCVRTESIEPDSCDSLKESGDSGIVEGFVQLSAVGCGKEVLCGQRTQNAFRFSPTTALSLDTGPHIGFVSTTNVEAENDEAGARLEAAVN